MVSVFGAVLGWRTGKTLGKAGQTFFVAGLAAVMVSYLLWGRDSVVWTWIMPVSGVVMLSNPTPWLAATLAGLCLAQAGLPRWRRSALAVVLVAAGHYTSAQFFFSSPPLTVPTWVDDVALQTMPTTCSPAAAATLLATHGIKTNEREMSWFCLTNPQGTSLLGLYRGLSKATASQGLHPAIHFLSLDELQQRPDLLPAVVSVQLNREADAREPRYRERWGWILGVRHSVTFLRFDGPEHVWVGDPGVGLERWRLTHTRDLWVGDVMSLVSHD